MKKISIKDQIERWKAALNKEDKKFTETNEKLKALGFPEHTPTKVYFKKENKHINIELNNITKWMAILSIRKDQKKRKI